MKLGFIYLNNLVRHLHPLPGEERGVVPDVAALLPVVETGPDPSVPHVLPDLVGHPPHPVLPPPRRHQRRHQPRRPRHPPVVGGPPPEPALVSLDVALQPALVGEARLPHQGAVTEDPHHAEPALAGGATAAAAVKEDAAAHHATNRLHCLKRGDRSKVHGRIL